MIAATWRALRLLVLLPMVATSATQAAVVFEVDASRSQLSLGGTIEFNGHDFSPLQQPVSGSMQTRYAGSIRLDRDLSTVKFLGGVVDASVNGTYAPGPAAADYGVYAPGTGGKPNVYGALRNFTFCMSGTPSPVGTGFDLSGVNITALSGTFESDTLPTIALAGATAVATSGTASLTDNFQADLYTLRLPITTVFVEPFPGTNDTLTFALSGMLIATAHTPEPSTLAMLAAGATAFIRRRRQRR